MTSTTNISYFDTTRASPSHAPLNASNSSSLEAESASSIAVTDCFTWKLNQKFQPIYKSKEYFEIYYFRKIVIGPRATYFAWEKEDAASVHKLESSLVEVREKSTLDPNCQAGDFLIRSIWSRLWNILWNNLTSTMASLQVY